MTTPRKFEMSIDLAASPDEVWAALTDPHELVRWFPLQAEVKAGAGGEIRWAWGAQFDWMTRIDVWEPGRRLLLHQAASLPLDLDGRSTEGSGAEPAVIAIEFMLERLGSVCRLRVVHSGFGRGAAWDDELDGISHGWQSELRSLRHYLARHPRETRHAAWAFRTTNASSPADALARLTSADGFSIEVTTVAVGLPWAVRTPWDEVIRGEVILALPSGEMSGSAREYRDGLLRFHAWRAGGATGATGVGVGLSAWGDEAGLAERVSEFERRAGEALTQLFPEPA